MSGAALPSSSDDLSARLAAFRSAPTTPAPSASRTSGCLRAAPLARHGRYSSPTRCTFATGTHSSCAARRLLRASVFAHAEPFDVTVREHVLNTVRDKLRMSNPRWLRKTRDTTQ